MDNIYIDELMDRLKKIEIWEKNKKIDGNYDKKIELLVNTFMSYKRNQSQIFFIGNGGSAAIASHMIADFMKNGGMNTRSLYDDAILTCMGNDYGYESVFSKPLEMCLRKGDLVVAISSSGNSENIVNAIHIAHKKKAKVITFTGFGENNKAKQLGDINLYVSCERYGMVESIHNLILQQIVDTIMSKDGVSC